MRTALLHAVALCFALAVCGSWPQADRDVNQAPGTARVAGTIVSGDRGDAVPGALVTLVEVWGHVPVLSTTTDSVGSFAFTDLPEGRYTLSASKPSYLSTEYGARDSGLPGTPVVVSGGQQLLGLVLRISRGSTMAGSVFDSWARPVPGTQVLARRLEILDGIQSVAPERPTSATTDDHGGFRLYGLYSGAYLIVCPRPPSRFAPSSSPHATVAVPSTAAGKRGAAPTGAPNLTSVPEFLPVYFPGTTSATEAVPILVDGGSSRTDVNLFLPFVDGAELRGHVIPPSDVSLADLQTTIDLVPLAAPAGPPASTRLLLEPSAYFTFRGVAPGSYRLDVSAVRRIANTRASAWTSGWWSSAEMSVSDQNAGEVTLQLERGSTLEVAVAVEGASLPAEETSMLVVSAKSLDDPPGSERTIQVRSGSSGWFVFNGLAPGRYALAVSLPDDANPMYTPDWDVSIVTDGQQVQGDRTITIDRESEKTVTVTLTRWQNSVGGRFLDRLGMPRLGDCVVILPVDERQWTRDSRSILERRPATDGTFLFVGLPAGIYALAAAECRRITDTYDPAWLRAVLGTTPMRFALRRGQQVTQDIRVVGGSPPGSANHDVLGDRLPGFELDSRRPGG
jgi:hypothetical protein